MEHTCTLAGGDLPTTDFRQGKTIRVESPPGWAGLNLGELIEYRELLYFLVWRDLQVRYKQTALGVAWAVIQPLFTMLVFSLFFGRLAKMPSDGVPYPLFAYIALTPWTFFANGMGQSSNSLVASANLITKVYFPRLTIPFASVLSGVPDFLLGFVLALAMMAYYGIAPSMRMTYILVFFALAAATTLGIGLWLSALNVQYRDVRYVVPFLTQLWMLATPIAYPSSLVHGRWAVLYGINPMVGVVEGFRWALLNGHRLNASTLATSVISAAALLASGLVYFRRMEKSFADVV